MGMYYTFDVGEGIRSETPPNETIIKGMDYTELRACAGKRAIADLEVASKYTEPGLCESIGGLALRGHLVA